MSISNYTNNNNNVFSKEKEYVVEEKVNEKSSENRISITQKENSKGLTDNQKKIATVVAVVIVIFTSYLIFFSPQAKLNGQLRGKWKGSRGDIVEFIDNRFVVRSSTDKREGKFSLIQKSPRIVEFIYDDGGAKCFYLGFNDDYSQMGIKQNENDNWYIYNKIQ